MKGRMPKAVHEVVKHKNCAGIQYGFYTISEKYEPLHWHDEWEILYYLNGDSSLIIDGARYQLPKKQAVVINSGQVHNTFYHDAAAMYLCVHIDPAFMEEYIPDIRTYWIECHPEKISEEDFEEYRKICALFEQITEQYIRGDEIFFLEATGVILQIFAVLLQSFSEKIPLKSTGNDVLSRDRIRKVVAFTEEHYMEQISLDDMAGLLGFGKEYFCRFFKKNMGMPFGRYLNEVRASKIHHDLIHTDIPIADLMEKHGFLNSRLFYETFRNIYGCRPLQVRKGKNPEDGAGLPER